MKPLNIISSLAILILFTLSLSCNYTSKKDSQSTLYYSDFDLFSLKGKGVLQGSAVGRSVEVVLEKNIPTSITYNLLERTVVLTLVDSFKANSGRPVLVYITGNLLGGKSGKQREYSTRFIDNRYVLFIDCSDTIIVKKFDAIDAESGAYDCYINSYSKCDSLICDVYLERVSSEKIKGTPEQKLFDIWRSLAAKKVKESIGIPSKIESLPPE